MGFNQTEKKFKNLKAKFKAGTLSENEFKLQLEELMVQDNNGNWWMIGYETEHWYRYNGKDWIQADPPGIPSIKNKVEQKIDTNFDATKPDRQTSFWRFGRREVVLSLIGLGIYALLTFSLKTIDPPFRYWFPSHAVSLFFGLVFGPIVGAIIGGGQHIIYVISIYSGFYSLGELFLRYFSSIVLIAFAVEGAIMGFIKIIPASPPSFKIILRTELFIILANLARILLSTNIASFFRDPPSHNYWQVNLWYPLLGNLIIVPISLVVYSFILSRRKQ